ncbi:hypothetical protein BN85403520 [Alteracholeplasma palmae J233]|uniref:AB hydrolase-1 domain-containing protein n=1 Tax=Alteracholeplasma palmae (strain ATCC 49389 / J233) TaxID=1318466 RepID=U4KK10_ALTPJ|nr:alpha/beta fold hydrolase [Alteracholeplasma palmae]CCV63929.1 hypothetical protein BN85403520 [Alteracholeplasma palmae J233]
MKKIYSTILLIVVAITTLSFTYGNELNDLGNEILYNETNTYNYDKTRLSKEGSLYNIEDPNLNKVSNSEPLVTFITHGLGGSASHWSNLTGFEEYKKYGLNETEISKEVKEEFSYTEDSIISMLSYLSDSNIFFAGFDENKNSHMVNLNKQNIDKTTVLGRVYDINTSSPYKESHITDISKHTIIVFESSRKASTGPNNDVYEEFNYLASKVIYDIKKLNGNILPKVNLIGHSRGGITNLQYALDHPDLVHSVFSFGTPYFGSETLRLGKELGVGEASKSMYQDINDTEKIEKYYNRWNDNYHRKYYKINVHALGGYSSLNSLVDLFVSSDYLIEELMSRLQETLQKNLDKEKLKKFLLSLEKGIISTGEWSFKIYGLFSDSFLGIDDILKTIPQTKIIIAHMQSQIRKKHFFAKYMYYSDVLVDLPSQIGEKGDLEYLGFNKYEKEFNTKNSNPNKLASNTFTVVHNMETRDIDFVGYVVRNIKMNSATNNKYELYHINDSEVEIVNYLGSGSETVEIPQEIEGKTVVRIYKNAFSFSKATKVIVPSTVANIGKSAFSNMENLKEIDLSKTKITELNEYLFSGDKQLVDVKLPEGLKTIKESAFYDNHELENISIPNTVIKIEKSVFENNKKLKKISLPNNLESIENNFVMGCENLNSLELSNQNKVYSVDENVLYNKDKTTLFIYPQGKNNEYFRVPSSVSYIATESFIGNQFLKSIDLNKTIEVGARAFEKSGNLQNIETLDIKKIGLNAFSGTKWLDKEVEYAILGNTLVKYKGSKEKIEAYDIPVTINRIDQNSFAYTEVKEITLPKSVKSIATNAFYQATKLEKIILLGNPVLEYGFIDKGKVSVKMPNSLYINTLSENGHLDIRDNLEILKTEVTLVDNGKSDTKTFLYGEPYNIDNGSINAEKWYSADGKVYEKSGVWNYTGEIITLKTKDKKDLEIMKGNKVIYTYRLVIGDSYNFINNEFYVNGNSVFTLPKPSIGYEYDLSQLETKNYDGSYSSIELVEKEIVYSVKIMNHVPNGDNSNYDIKKYTYKRVMEDGFKLFYPREDDKYDFNGLYYDSNYDESTKINDPKEIIKYKTLYGKWSKKTFKVVLNYNDNITPKEEILIEFGEPITLPEKTRNYYESSTWKDSDNRSFSFGTKITVISNLDLYIDWKLTEYDITYYNVDRIDSNRLPKTYNIESEITLENISRKGFKFEGWYTSSYYTTSKNKINKGSAGNAYFYAKWSIDFSYNRGERLITDKGITKNHYDVINIKDYTGYTITELRRNGYENIIISISLTMWEKSDGYQHIYISDSLKETNHIYSEEYDHKEGSKSVTRTLTISCNISRFTDDSIFILFDASGWSNDDWYNIISVNVTGRVVESNGNGGSCPVHDTPPINPGFEIIYC